MRCLGILVVAALAVSAASSAMASGPLRSQIVIGARIAEVSGEINAGLGVDFRDMGGSYRSTSNELPGSGSTLNINGLGTVGGTLWFNTGAMAPAPGDPNALNLGVALNVSGFFGGDDDILKLSRHNNNDIVDTVLSRSIDYTVDVTARASIPIIVVPRITPDGNNVVLFIEPFAGLSVIGTETNLMSDRTGIGGPNLTGSQINTKIGLVTGTGISTEIGKMPFFGDIPILAGLFYKARYVPGTTASVTAGGVTETGSVDSGWEHEALLVLIAPFIVKNDRDDAY